MLEAALYLIPVTLGDTPHDRVLPAYNREVTSGIRHFVVENVRSARRFLKRCDPATDIDAITFYTLDRHTPPEAVAGFLAPLAQGLPVGVISEAGCPAVADPGADVVAVAQRKGYKVVPLVGPSSILLALMASGCTGQRFSFNGYLPVNRAERTRTLRAFERQSAAEDRTQIFIETPYRNTQLFEEMTATLQSTTRLTIARDITTPEEWIRTKTIKEWRNEKPDLHKRPAIFVLHA